MTFQQLTYVVEISKCGSINKAAHKLFLSQSGISTAVRELEEELGIKFFVRSNRGVEFTPEGKEFLSYAVSLLEQKRGLVHAEITHIGVDGLPINRLEALLQRRSRDRKPFGQFRNRIVAFQLPRQ